MPQLKECDEVIISEDSSIENSIYQLISDLKKERYPVNLTGVCKSYIYRIGKAIVIKVSLFPFSKEGYPISAVRVIKSEKEIKTAVKYILTDLF